jgi:hypothetical protein
MTGGGRNTRPARDISGYIPLIDAEQADPAPGTAVISNRIEAKLETPLSLCGPVERNCNFSQHGMRILCWPSSAVEVS